MLSLNSGFGALEGREYSLFYSKSLGSVTTDFQPCCMARRAVGGALLVGGQTALFDDLARWVESRALREHAGNLVEGVKAAADNALPLVSMTPTALRFTQESAWDTAQEFARVPASAPLTLKFSLAAASTLGVQVTICNLATGAVAHEVLIPTSAAGEYSQAIPSLAAASYIVHAALLGGEYAALKFVAGAGAYAGDACHVNAVAGVHAWEESADVLLPKVIEPRIRKIGDMRLIDGDLWATGMLAGRNGRATFLFKLGDDLNIVSRYYAAPESAPLVQSNDPAGIGVALLNDARGARVVVLTHQARYVLEPLTGSLQQESESGGRGFALLQRRDGFDVAAQLGEDAQDGNAIRFSTESAASFPLAAAVDGALAASTHFYGITPNLGSDEETQALCRFIDSGPRPVTRWNRKRGEYSRGHEAGTSIVFYGFSRMGAARLLRLRGEMAQLHWDCSYAATWTGSGTSEDGKAQHGFLIGKRLNGAITLSGWYLAETSGELQTAVFEWDEAEEEFVLE
jgi:hypothetical protein